MKTKNKIIGAAIQLFNQFGITQVSLRQIAAAIDISHGNLAYHYKGKNDILHEIYTKMDEEMSGAVFPEGTHTLVHYHRLLKRISAFRKSYEFFYMDLLSIAREYPEVIERHRKTITKRSEEYDHLIRHLIGKGLVKTEKGPGFYKSLFHSIWVMSTFWLQQRRVLGENHPLIISGSDIKHVWEILLPHLTRKGLKEYREFVDPDIQKLRPIQKVYLSQLN